MEIAKAVDHESLAHRAIDMMQMMPYDSFGPIDAVRALPEYENLSAEDREAVLKSLHKIIGR
ncbi:hypothetical protein P9A53_gp18 [Xanthomonas phage vB_Xar_IVIA-DoCa6]|uniref:Uncharacterized protein n=1 Tax=Xanthomonas phage vB_Xar_IVIA-DoCa6 TaxID=2975533 RepID=A0A9X9JQV2_9CAUD|nr:hypothetical protein P9A52_gp23 [Stenotrophomonas phage vB_SmaS-AXL_1]YP_010739068.1 hypothetical protein P9A53_gp18 [Xanthomonas phage vB_Xar_IVIA-DoCa6]UIS24801.1 hypothetical protein AXL1_23 [Stenotrophomonas phage vB_SmaS-AXL_1]UYA98762.1 hypothetical protein IVIADoCa6_18 [Xanthomonas phage vB_Xar_IVIA-DoCa6]